MLSKYEVTINMSTVGMSIATHFLVIGRRENSVLFPFFPPVLGIEARASHIR